MYACLRGTAKENIESTGVVNRNAKIEQRQRRKRLRLTFVQRMSPFHIVLSLAGCVLVDLIAPALGFGSGAPNRACVTMTPVHRGQSPQTSLAPYAVQVNQDSYLPGQEISVTINTTCTRDFFQGFMIQARRVDINSNTDEPIGLFNIPQGSRVVLGCGSFAQAITHNSQSDKESLTFVWTAPEQSQGDLVFLATFARGYTTFWPKIKSSIIRDGQSAARADTGGEVFPTPSRCAPPSLAEPPTQQVAPSTTTTTATTTTATQPPTTTTTTPPLPTTTPRPPQTQTPSRETTTRAPFQADPQSTATTGMPPTLAPRTPTTTTAPTLNTKSLNTKEKEVVKSNVSSSTLPSTSVGSITTTKPPSAPSFLLTGTGSDAATLTLPTSAELTPDSVISTKEATVSSTGITTAIHSSDEPTGPPTVRSSKEPTVLSTVRISDETTIRLTNTPDIPSSDEPTVRTTKAPTLRPTNGNTVPVTSASVSPIYSSTKSIYSSTDRSKAQSGQGSVSTALPSTSLPTPSEPGCGSTKSCYSWCPGGNCRFNITAQYKAETLLVEMSSKIPSTGRHWLALGLSSDRAMDDDSVVECVMTGDNVEVFTSYNDGYSNVRIGQAGISEVSGRVEDGVLGCTFQRSLRVNGDPRIFDLTNQSAWYLFLASGTMDGGKKRQHTTTPHVSDGKVDLRTARQTNEMEDVPSPGRRTAMIKVHGSLMLVAWVFCASVGIIVARYYKLLGGKKTCYNDRYSFHVHRAAMTITLVCVVVSIIIIFVEVDGFSKIHSSEGLIVQAHPILGITVTSLVLINFSMGLLRPAPGRTVRPVYNWGHWATGTAAWITAFMTILLGFAIERASVHPAAKYVLLGFVALHLLLQLFLEWFSCRDRSTLDRPDKPPPEKHELQTLDSQNDRKHGMYDPQQEAVEGVGKLKKVVFCGYIFALLIILFALLILVNMKFEM